MTEPQDRNENLPVSSTTGRVDQLTRRLENTAPAVNRRQSDFQSPHSSHSASAHGRPAAAGFLEYWRMMRRRKWVLVLCTILGGIGGLLYTLPQTPVYRATTTIEVLDMDTGLIGFKDDATSQNAASETNMQTQVDIIGSSSLQERVVRRLMASEKTIEQPVDRLAKWRHLLNLPEKPKFSKEEILRVTSDGVNATPTTGSRIIRVDCDSANPKVAADYVNALADEFINERMESHWQATQKTGEYLTRQMEELKVKLVASEDALQRYAKETNLQFTSDQANQSVAEQKLAQLQTELSKVQEDRIARQSRYELAEKAPVDTLPEVLDDDTLKADQQKLADTRRQLAERLVTYTTEDPTAKKYQASIGAIEADMKRIRARILDKIHSEMAVAQTRENLLTQAVETQAALVSDEATKTVRYNILKREVDTNRQIWETLLQRVKEAGIAAAMRSSNFRVVDPASPPSIPVKPSLRHGIMAGLVMGLFAGIGFVFVRENMDRSIAVPGEATYYLGAPELAVIPSTLPEATARRFLNGLARRKQIAGVNAVVERGAFQHGDSMVAESFRVALTSLLFANKRSGPPKAITVSSPGPTEGKTTVACNLAISYAEINWRVLLIDGDMRRPRLHDIFNVEHETGIATLLDRAQPVRLEDVMPAIRQTAVPNLSVMPRGKLRGTVINLLYSPRLAEVLSIARKEFHVVIIDTPPMLHLPDARAIAHLTDGVVFVVRSGKTLRDTVMTARERFHQDGIPVLGSILNGWNPKETGYYGHYDNYEDYRASYYSNDTGRSS